MSDDVTQQAIIDAFDLDQHYGPNEIAALFSACARLATSAPDSEKLREASERYRQALEDVCNPLGYLQRMAEAEGACLSGMAYSIANDPVTLQRIASEALGASS